jgi:predicted RNA methylase
MPLATGDVVLDCGANVGSFARMAAPVLGPRGTILCLEPMPAVCAALRLNCSIYQQWADRKGLQIARVVPIQAGETAWFPPRTRLHTRSLA